MKFFHGSGTELAVGLVLKAHRKSFVRRSKLSISMTEAVLERTRPSNCIPRRDCVFLSATSDPEAIAYSGGLTSFIYLVEPIGSVEKGHVGWWSMINQNLFKSDPETLESYARSYWSGENPPDNMAYRGWEYRCRQASVVLRVS